MNSQMSPASMALAYRIWAHANARGWDCSIAEVAEALGESEQRVARIAQIKGWCWRFRAGVRIVKLSALYDGTRKGGAAQDVDTIGILSLRALGIESTELRGIVHGR